MASDSAVSFVNATVVDGTGAPAVEATVTVVGDRVASVGDEASGEVIDATGLVLAPGFIDVHTHDDLAVVYAPDHACKTLQGVTTVVVGNCGSSVAPLVDGDRSSPFDTMGAYFDAVEAAAPAVNVAALIGHGTIRTAVMGRKTAREADADELAAMAAHVEAAMTDGAVGLSSGLAYEPGRYAHPDELVRLNRVVGAAGGIYTTHMRDEGDHLLESIDEAIAAAEGAGVPLQISHLKAAGRNNWGAVADALDRIEAARGRGVDVMADQYPYTRGSSLLEQVVSAGAMDGPSPFGQVTGEQLLIAAAPRNPTWEGQTVAEIAADAGVESREMADRIIEAEGRACIIVLDIMSEDDVQTVMQHPLVMTGSDGIPLGDRPHPRLHHTYPRVLGHYGRELGLLNLEDAVHRMTGMPAERFGFADRGVICEGALADLVLFDPATVGDTGTYTDPTTVPTGIQSVWVNGTQVVDAGAPTGLRPGRVLKRT